MTAQLPLAEDRDLSYYEDVRDLLDEMLGTRRAEEVADMLTAATLIIRLFGVDRHLVLDVFVPGRPAPQGSIRAVIHRSTGRAVAIKDNDKTQKAWRQLVVDALTDQAGRAVHAIPPETAVSIGLAFVMPRPLGTPKRRTPPAIRKPDIDKLARNLLDGITAAGVIDDDARVVDLHATKRIAELGETPGCHITIHTPVGEP